MLRSAHVTFGPLLHDMNEEGTGLLAYLSGNLLLLLKVIAIIAAAFVLERFIRILLKRAYLRSDKGFEDRTRYRFLRNGTRFVVTLVTIIVIVNSIPSFKDFASTLFVGTGILVAIIGFAAQGAFSNIISGIFIVSFKPFRVGDWLQVAGHTGVVEDITLRHTVLVTAENRRVIMPNSKISDETIINSTITDPAVCQFVEVGIAYESDLDKAMEVLRQECEAHPDCMDRRTPAELERGAPRVAVQLISIGDSALTLRAYAWAADHSIARGMRYDLLRSLKLRFDREGIVLPYPQRTIRVEGPLSMKSS
ncbi:MAG: mechanosensitive ion channel family protein [Flavobacteriales bacterium]|nr:mechanosensitive ion channel family protein [Flavobacteriales bacterium]